MNFIHFSVIFFQQVCAATLFGSILALAIIAIQFVVGRQLGPGWRHALWLLVVVRLILPVFPESRFSLFNAPQWIESVTPRSARVTVTLLEIVSSAPHVPMKLETTPVDFSEPFPETPSPKQTATPFEILSLIWLSVSILLLLRLAIGSCWLRFRLANKPTPTDATLIRILSEARSRLRTLWRPIPMETPCVGSPGLFGVLRPRLLLPPGIAHQLSEPELRQVFLHEIAHLKRGDLWVNLVMNIIQAFHWFNPLVWFVLRQMRLERELACDALVLRATPEEEVRSYGETILKLLERVTTPPAFAAVVGILEEKQSAASRLTQIAQFRSKRPPSHKLGTILLSLFALVGLSNSQTEKRGSDVAPHVTQAAITEPSTPRESVNVPRQDLQSAEIPQKPDQEQKALAEHTQALYTRSYKVNPNTFIQGLDGIYLTQNPFIQYRDVIGQSRDPGAAGSAGAGQTAGGVGPGSYFQLSADGVRLNTADSGGGIIGVTHPSSANFSIQDAVRNFFIAAGLHFDNNSERFFRNGDGLNVEPQKAIFFDDLTGVLRVRAPLADLDVVENTLLALEIRPLQITIETSFVEIQPGSAYEQELLLRVIATNKSSSVLTITELMSDPQFKAVTDALAKAGPSKLNSAAGIDPDASASTGILTEQQFQQILEALKNASGVSILASPKITTLSNRGARVSIDPGPSATVLPVVESDGASITLSVTAETPPEEKRKLAAVKASVKATVPDGQTLVIRPGQTKGRTMIIFLTPIITDPAGNRVHPAATAPATIPIQSR